MKNKSNALYIVLAIIAGAAVVAALFYLFILAPVQRSIGG